MARKWTKEEERKYYKELYTLYVKENKSLREIAIILGIAEPTVFDRLTRLGIKTQPHLKIYYLKKRTDVALPKKYSDDLAEFFGIMLGDGHVSHFQVTVHLGNKEMEYAKYLCSLILSIFHVEPKISTRKKTNYRDVYLGSTLITSWLFKQGLVSNKVKSQVGAPPWIFRKKAFMRRFLRGFFDTDGSVYKLKHGIQISLSNRSLPLLQSIFTENVGCFRI